MAGQTFAIVELQRTGDGGFVDTPSRFDWTAAGRSAPEDHIEFSVEVKTVRDDYPGATEPTEQVLNAHYGSITLHGRWDDRWNSVGFAQSEADRFEALVKRVPYVRITFERIAFVGIITSGKITYRRSTWIGWEFTFSPHYRITSGTVVRQPAVVPKVPTTPKARTDEIAQRMAALSAIHATSPRQYITADSFALVDRAMDKLTAVVEVAASVTASRVMTISDRPDGVSSVSRMKQAFVDIADAAQSVYQQVAGYRSDNNTAYPDPVVQTSFDAWTKGLAAGARAIALAAWRGAVDLRSRVQGDVLAFYRPTAGESLYAISQRFYGSPFQWRTIMSRNNLFGLLLDGTEELIIPKLGANTTAAGA